MIMVSPLVSKKIYDTYNNRPFVLEGANGSIALSILKVFQELNIIPNRVLLTTASSDLENEWKKSGYEITHLRFMDSEFYKKKEEYLTLLPEVTNVIYGAGYGRPNKFLGDPEAVIKSNVHSLLKYCQTGPFNTFAYISTSEIYTGSPSEVNEDSPFSSSPQHPRSVYIESKRLGEAIITHLVCKKFKRAAIYRTALATPPRMLRNDQRVLSDLIRSAKNEGIVSLKGGSELIRQYQYGPNAAYKMLGSLVNGISPMYINAGAHIVTLGELAQIVARIFKVPYEIESSTIDSSSPQLVLLNFSKINYDSQYTEDQEKDLEFYLRKIVDNSSETGYKVE